MALLKPYQDDFWLHLYYKKIKFALLTVVNKKMTSIISKVSKVLYGGIMEREIIDEVTLLQNEGVKRLHDKAVEAAAVLISNADSAAELLVSNADNAAESIRNNVYKAAETLCRIGADSGDKLRNDADEAANKLRSKAKRDSETLRSDAKIAAEALVCKAKDTAIALQDSITRMFNEAHSKQKSN